jgi:catechol 2,3-dioxygenase-like lactoylglutathione lyase family enzyme
MAYPSINAQITFLDTHDLEITAQFYEEAMGFPLVLDQGGCRIYETAQNAYLGFCERSPVAAEVGVIFTLVTDEVDRWYERLRDADVPIEKAPALNEVYGIYHCFVRDPNGYLIEIQKFLDPNWRDAETLE